MSLVLSRSFPVQSSRMLVSRITIHKRAVSSFGNRAMGGGDGIAAKSDALSPFTTPPGRAGVSPATPISTTHLRARVGVGAAGRPRSRSQILSAARGRVLPDFVAVIVEHQSRIGWRRVPHVAGKLALKLPWPPAGIAEGDEAFPW